MLTGSGGFGRGLGGGFEVVRCEISDGGLSQGLFIWDKNT